MDGREEGLGVGRSRAKELISFHAEGTNDGDGDGDGDGNDGGCEPIQCHDWGEEDYIIMKIDTYQLKNPSLPFQGLNEGDNGGVIWEYARPSTSQS